MPVPRAPAGAAHRGAPWVDPRVDREATVRVGTVQAGIVAVAIGIVEGRAASIEGVSRDRPKSNSKS